MTLELPGLLEQRRALDKEIRAQLDAGPNTITVDLSALVDASMDSLHNAVRRFLAELFEAAIEKSPKDTGRFKANWNISLSGPNYSYDDRTTPDSIRKHVIPNMPFNTETVKAWLCNGLPYAAVLEYGLYPDPPKKGTGKTEGGYSIQAPFGMIRVTAAEYQTYLDRALGK